MGMYDYDRRGYTGRVGMAYLVPYYRGMNYADEAGLTTPALSGHSSDMASVDLNTSSYLSVRIHGVDTDFADFYTIDIVNDLPYSRGTGAYKVSYCVLEDGYGDACSLAFPCKNGEPCETVGRQANKHDLAKYAANDKLKVFFMGLSSTRSGDLPPKRFIRTINIIGGTWFHTKKFWRPLDMERPGIDRLIGSIRIRGASRVSWARIVTPTAWAAGPRCPRVNQGRPWIWITMWGPSTFPMVAPPVQKEHHRARSGATILKLRRRGPTVSS